MIRILAWLWHRHRGEHWMRRAAARARAARAAFIENRICAERARAHFARADALYPRGPPARARPTEGE